MIPFVLGLAIGRALSRIGADVVNEAYRRGLRAASSYFEFIENL